MTLFTFLLGGYDLKPYFGYKIFDGILCNLKQNENAKSLIAVSDVLSLDVRF